MVQKIYSGCSCGPRLLWRMPLPLERVAVCGYCDIWLMLQRKRNICGQAIVRSDFLSRLLKAPVAMLWAQIMGLTARCLSGGMNPKHPLKISRVWWSKHITLANTELDRPLIQLWLLLLSMLHNREVSLSCSACAVYLCVFVCSM